MAEWQERERTMCLKEGREEVREKIRHICLVLSRFTPHGQESESAWRSLWSQWSIGEYLSNRGLLGRFLVNRRGAPRSKEGREGGRGVIPKVRGHSPNIKMKGKEELLFEIIFVVLLHFHIGLRCGDQWTTYVWWEHDYDIISYLTTAWHWQRQPNPKWLSCCRKHNHKRFEESLFGE